MQYWVQIAGIHLDRPLTKEELFSKYRDRLTGETPCSKVGENKWGKLSDYFPDWQNSQAEAAPIEPDLVEPETPTRRYPALRVLSVLYRVLAVVVGIAAFIVIMIGISMENVQLIFGGIIGGAFGVITNLAIAEFILLFLDIEKNTRK